METKIDMDAFNELLFKFFTGTGITIARTVAIFIFGLLAVKLIMLIANKIAVRAKIEKTVSSFILSVINVLLYFALLLFTGKSAGISTASFVALISAAGLAISLALKDSLSNLANGFIILGSKPFVVGDYVAVNGVEGTVKSIGFFNTKLVSYDNIMITLPNSSLIGSSVTNYTANPTRRVTVSLKFSYDVDTDKVGEIMTEVGKSFKEVLTSPAPSAVVDSFTDSAVVMTLRLWTPTEMYWDVLFKVNEKLVSELQKSGVDVSMNKLDVKLVNGGQKQ
ncbi:MAG: mechanosensitive ion channel family protein [Eubacteriales bacterium]|nr:mechanosensitive ion channel family protein [Christensenellaceae bacterium]MDY2751904.1 mechanosensitive ion channel family protein [Eubacteriales bacterium]